MALIESPFETPAPEEAFAWARELAEATQAEIADLDGPTARAEARAIGPEGYTVLTVENATITAHGSSAHSSSTVAPPGPAEPAVILEGTPGDDVFDPARAGRDRHIDGGSGLDSVLFAAPRAQVERSIADGFVMIARPDGGTDRLVAVERAVFPDGTYLFDLDGSDGDLGACYRLYAAALGRTPDESGLRHWLEALSEGLGRDALADAFVASEEFEAALGDAAADEDFVAGLYDRVLGRAPDAAGLAHWVDRLGEEGFDRGDMLAVFAESEENVLQTAPDLEDGVLVF